MRMVRFWIYFDGRINKISSKIGELGIKWFEIRLGTGCLLGRGKEFGHYPKCSGKPIKSVRRGVPWLH